jgi:dipeptidyl aminopeptidase/acylaminoacyl peptidase
MKSDWHQHGCINCHTFRQNRPDPMILQVREVPGKTRFGMVMTRNGHAEKIDTRTRFNRRSAGFMSWHPNGTMAAFSTNHFGMYIHSSGFLREVFDFASDLGIYHFDTSTVTTTPAISDPVRYENFPTWSPDGEYLYFCSAPDLPVERYQELRYDLMRIGYDAATGEWGELETVLSADETHLSITQPRISPDGRFLLFCMSDYGNFAVYQPSSDLYMMDTATGRWWRPDALNSDRCESWHTWSSNSRWIVFSSKRLDGLYSRPFMSHIAPDGQVGKPVLLPQEDPRYYDSLLKTYNVPELVTAPVQIDREELIDAICAPEEAPHPTFVPTSGG